MPAPSCTPVFPDDTVASSADREYETLHDSLCEEKTRLQNHAVMGYI